MTDDTLVNGLKAIFGTSAQGSAPASSALIPYMDSSGNPVGLSSMSNLASVLGGQGTILPENSDLDNYNSYGVWYYSSTGSRTATISNKPSDLTLAFSMICYPSIGGNGNMMQILYPFEAPGNFYIRHQKRSGWTSWAKYSGTQV